MRVAALVDAGYLYKAGSIALTGSETDREHCELDLAGTIAKLRVTIAERTDNAILLRIYWYDGMRGGRLSDVQQQLAFMGDVKLRLGMVRGGRQKGVDSLIVTDLIGLARNNAISDAVLLGGDDDLRVGVEIAQSFGVRVHLLGIDPSRANQSDLLMQEADTTAEWSKADVKQILEFKPVSIQWTDGDTVSAAEDNQEVLLLDQAVGDFLTALSPDDLKNIAALQPSEGIPHQYDGRLLGTGRGKIGRDLTESEKRYARNNLKEQAKAKVGTSQTNYGVPLHRQD